MWQRMGTARGENQLNIKLPAAGSEGKRNLCYT